MSIEFFVSQREVTTFLPKKLFCRSLAAAVRRHAAPRAPELDLRIRRRIGAAPRAGAHLVHANLKLRAEAAISYARALD